MKCLPLLQFDIFNEESSGSEKMKELLSIFPAEWSPLTSEHVALLCTVLSLEGYTIPVDARIMSKVLDCLAETGAIEVRIINNVQEVKSVYGSR